MFFQTLIGFVIKELGSQAMQLVVALKRANFPRRMLIIIII